MFVSSVFLCLGVCLVLFGIFGYLISIKLNEQNEKIKNMFDLIYTINNDLQLLRLYTPTTLQQSSQTIPPTTTSTSTITDTLSNSIDIGTCISNIISPYDSDLITSTNGRLTGTIIKKIVVSDCEVSTQDGSNDDEDSTDNDDESVADSETDSNDDEKEENDDTDDDTKLCSIKKLDNAYTYELTDLDSTTNTLSELYKPSSPPTNNSNVIDLDEVDKQKNTITDYDDGIQCSLIIDSSESLELPHTPTKTIVVDLDKSEPDYNKMSIHQLKKIAIERNLITTSSKLKKNELLKMLLV